MQLRRAFWSILALLIVIAAPSVAMAAGALAIDGYRGQKWGYSYDHRTLEAARAAALGQCGPNCQVVLTFQNTCAAFAADQSRDNGATGWGWAQSKEKAQETAMKFCRQYGGTKCLVRVWACESFRANDARASATRETSVARVDPPQVAPPPAPRPVPVTPPPVPQVTPPPAPLPQVTPPQPTFTPVPTLDGSRRFALVIGNDAYESLEKLQKAVNDARSISDSLGKLGFEVIRVENAPRRLMNQRIAEFTSKIGRGDTAFVFYSGHGVEIRGVNYLLGVDVPPAKEGQETLITGEGIPADILIERLQERGAKITMMVLDACRENPFKAPGTRGVGATRGLAQMTAPEGVFVLYSAGVGQTALDRLSDSDPNPNSVFTRTLVRLLGQPGLSIQEVAKTTQAEVRRLAGTINHPQMPAYYDQILGQFTLLPRR